MYIPRLLPEELLSGYRGRLRMLNGLRDGLDVTIKLNGARLGRRNHQRCELAFVELAAEHNECSLYDVVMQHSLWPFSSAVDRPRLQEEVECVARTQSGRTEVMRAARPDAWLCGSCVKEDLAFWGVSYWRRGHQLPGVLWCDKHGTALRRASLCSIELGPPDHCLDKTEDLDAETFQRCQSNGIGQTFVGICSDVLASAVPLTRTACARALVEKALESGACQRPRDVGMVLSDLARIRVPLEWRRHAFPKIDWTRGGLVKMIDAVCRVQQYPASTAAIAFVAAIIFNSADDALRALSEEFADRQAPPLQPQRPFATEPPAIAS